MQATWLRQGLNVLHLLHFARANNFQLTAKIGIHESICQHFCLVLSCANSAPLLHIQELNFLRQLRPNSHCVTASPKFTFCDSFAEIHNL